MEQLVGTKDRRQPVVTGGFAEIFRLTVTKAMPVGSETKSYFGIFAHAEERENDLQEIILFLLIGIVQTSFLFMRRVEILVNRCVGLLRSTGQLTKQVT